MGNVLTIFMLAAIILPTYRQQDHTQAAGNKRRASENTETPTARPHTAKCTVKDEGATVQCEWTNDESKGFFSRLFTAENTLNIAPFLVGLGGVSAALRTLGKIERQTAATETQARRMVKSERPFLMIEVSGDADSVYFKVWNKGRSPAKILYLDKLISPRILPISEKLPSPPEYGAAYEQSKAGAEMVNPDWIAPGSYTCTGIYWPRAELATIPEDEQAVSSGSSHLWVFGVVVYRGLFGDESYESRYCYRLGNGSWHMLGPDGYNEYK